MQQQQHQPNQPKRIVFTRDARLSVKRFAGPAEPQGERIATLSGYAMIWGALSVDRGGYYVRLLPGSAKFSPITHALYHHDYTHVIGSTENGTLRLYPDQIGVRVEIDLPDTTSGRDTEELVEERYVTGMSFAMVGSPTSEVTEENGQQILNVSSFACDEVTVTAVPAFTQTSIDVVQDNEPEETNATLSAKKKEEAAKEIDRQALQLQLLAVSMRSL